MDDIIVKYPSVPFGELNYAYRQRILYQRDMTPSISYDDAYFNHYVELEDSAISTRLNKGRVALSHKYCDECLLDIGVGSGEFIRKSSAKMYGYDINHVGVNWLKIKRIYVDPYEGIPPDVQGVTLWDTLEHISEPTRLLRLIRPKLYVFISLPIIPDLMQIRSSKHYKPGEHLTYWSVDGLITYMDDAGFDFLEISDQETAAGRENILSFVFCKRKVGNIAL